MLWKNYLLKVTRYIQYSIKRHVIKWCTKTLRIKLLDIDCVPRSVTPFKTICVPLCEEPFITLMGYFVCDWWRTLTIQRQMNKVGDDDVDWFYWHMDDTCAIGLDDLGLDDVMKRWYTNYYGITNINITLKESL